MDKLTKLLEKANSRPKTSNSGIKIFKRGQKLSLKGMLPPKKGKVKASQQIISLGIYCNAAGIQSAERQAQKLASQRTPFVRQRSCRRTPVRGSKRV